jgi:hypothetical protein
MSEHAHEDARLIVICRHVIDDHGALGVLWIQNGLVEVAVCLACAHIINTTNDQPETLRSFCTECAREAGLPVQMPAQDGFYELQDGRWERQPSESDLVN